MSNPLLISAWVSLDDLFEEEDARGLLTLSLEDPSGRVLAYNIFSAELEDDLDAISETYKHFYAILLTIVRQQIALEQPEDLNEFMTKNMRRLIAKDAMLRKSFTLAECKELATLINREEIDLSITDRITGLYLTLKMFELLKPDFYVVRLLNELPEQML